MKMKSMNHTSKKIHMEWNFNLIMDEINCKYQIVHGLRIFINDILP
jgi:hypothetical protein